MLSIAIASCLNSEERKEYLDRCIKNISELFKNKNIEILIGFDKYGKEIDGAKCYTHNNGMGHSWNWAIEEAKNDFILQIEDDWIVEIAQGNMENMPTEESFFNHLNNRIDILREFGGIYRFTSVDNEHWSSGKTIRKKNDYEYIELNRPKKFNENTWDMYYYSNQPHLKTKSFIKNVGKYIENSPPHIVEIDMCKKYYNSGQRVFMSNFFTLVHIGVKSAR